MTRDTKLRVLAAPGVLCPHHESQGRGGEKRFVARRWSDAEHGYESVGSPVEVPTISTESPHHASMLAEYARELRDGALLAADAETARIAGVPFDDEAIPTRDVVSVGKTPPGNRL